MLFLMSGRHCAAEDSGAAAVAHLASARSQKMGNGTLGFFIAEKQVIKRKERRKYGDFKAVIWKKYR